MDKNQLIAVVTGIIAFVFLSFSVTSCHESDNRRFEMRDRIEALKLVKEMLHAKNPIESLELETNNDK